MLSWEKFKDMSLEDAISCILRSQSRENSGVFNRQWRLLGLLVPMTSMYYRAQNYCRLKLGLQGKKTKITRTLLTVVELSYEATITVCLKVIVLQYFRC